MGGFGGRSTNEGPGTDHVFTGPMRSLKKTAPDGTHKHTDGHGDSMTNSAQRDRVGENAL